MSLPLLFVDELRGFYRSRVMLFLWVGMPVLALVVHLYAQDLKEMPVSALTALLVSSLSGTLASAMLVVSILSERERHVFDLFVVRPVRRRDILLSKFLAVYVCVVTAAMIAVGVGAAIDYFDASVPMDVVLEGVADSLVVTFAMLAVTAAAGVLIGIAAPSMLVGVILVIYGGNQMSAVIGVVGIYLGNAVLTVALGIALAGILLAIATRVFDRKQI
jgi:ABC-2 type transport system permease protein